MTSPSRTEIWSKVVIEAAITRVGGVQTAGRIDDVSVAAVDIEVGRLPVRRVFPLTLSHRPN
jgi:hypothetical protein